MYFFLQEVEIDSKIETLNKQWQQKLITKEFYYAEMKKLLLELSPSK